MIALRFILIASLLSGLGGCSYLVEKQSKAFSDNLSRTILNFDDPATIASAMPTLLIISDSFARQEDASANMQLSTAQMYGAFSGAFVKDPQRQARLSNRAFAYAKSGSCKSDKKWCDFMSFDNDQFQQLVDKLDADDVAVSYAVAVAWLGYIQANASDWSAVAGLSKAQQLLEVVVIFNESYDYGGAHLYLGALASTIPPALGGKPEVAVAHFERALELSDGKNLLVKVEYARRLARTTFDKELHHRLLTDVINSDPYADNLTLMNSWAIAEAKILLAGEDLYFD